MGSSNAKTLEKVRSAKIGCALGPPRDVSAAGTKRWVRPRQETATVYRCLGNARRPLRWFFHAEADSTSQPERCVLLSTWGQGVSRETISRGRAT